MRIRYLVWPLAVVVLSCQAEHRITSADRVTLAAPDTVVLTGEEDAPFWTLGGEPLRIGADPDHPNPAYGFSYIWGVGVMSDGRIVAADQFSREVRIFHPDGVLDTIVGGHGEGPGEFRHLYRVGLMRGDTIVAWDSDPKEVALFSPEGRFLTQSTMQGVPGFASSSVLGVFSDGSSLVWATRLHAAPRPDAYRRPDRYARFSRDGELLTRYPELPSWELFTDPRSGLQRVQFGQDPRRSVSGADWVYGPGDQAAFLVFDTASSSPRRLMLGATRRRDLEDRHIRRFREAFRKRYQDTESTILERSMREQRFPERMAAHGNLVLSSTGELWVQRPPRPGEPTALWTIYSPEGPAIGRLSLPSEWRLVQVKDSTMAAIVTDALDVQSIAVQRYRREAL